VRAWDDANVILAEEALQVLARVKCIGAAIESVK
jgi:hypothetical protein